MLCSKPDRIFIQTRYVQLAVLHISILITDPSFTLKCVCVCVCMCVGRLKYRYFKVARCNTTAALSFLREINSRPGLSI